MHLTIHKLIIVITVAFPLALLLLDLNAQSLPRPSTLQVAYNKTTSIVFPTPIASVDRGSRDLLAQKAKGVENVLQLKAARPAFQETNLTVITIDGVIRQFSIGYVKEPANLVVHVDDTVGIAPRRIIFQTEISEFDLKRYASNILEAKQKIRFISKKKYKVNLALRNIFIKDGVIFFHVRMKNESNINYDVDFLRFYIQDKTKVKRTASQEVDIIPLFTLGNDARILGKSEHDVVFALPKFTIPDAKYLAVEMFEQNGGRNINLQIKNRTIVNAQLID